MADLAELGIRISSEEAALADQRLDAFAASANRADAAADNLAGGARSASTAIATMNSAVRQQDAVLRSQQAVMRASTLEGLNLTRQFSDVGVSLATGMNPLLVFIQQGPQIADVFQQAAAEGRNFNTVLTGLYARLAPLLVPLAAVATAAGVAAGAFGLFHRSMSDDAAGDLSKSLNLTKEQLDRLKDSGVSTSVTIGDTFKATFQEIGANIVGVMSPVTSWLAETWGVTMDSITDAAVTGSQAVLAFFVGTYRAVMATWRNFPAAFGDMVIQGANAAITALNGLINRAVDGLNWLDAKFAGGQMQVAHFQAVLLQNPVAGAAARDAAETEAIYQKALEDVQGWGDDFAEGVNRRRIANRRKLIEEAAGDPNKGREGGKSETQRLTEETERYIQSLRDQAATLGMNAIAAKEYEIAQRAAKAASVGLNNEVEEAGRLLIEKMKAEVTSTRAMDDQIAMLELEARLIGASNVERAVALAQLAEEQRLRNAGVNVGDAGYAEAVARAGDLARAQENLRAGQDRYNDSLRLTLDLARQADGIMRDAARGFGDAFGEEGDALGGILTNMTGLNARLAEIAERRSELERQGMLTSERAAELERDRASATVGAYGDMLSAARGFFKEGSDGYNTLLAIERVYRIQQLLGAVQAMGIGQQETVMAVANSARRALAYGIEAVANAYRSIPYPFNIAAVAATVAGLAALGIRLAGGGSGGGDRGAANDNIAASTEAVQAYSFRDSQARDAAASAIASKVEVRVSADRDGLNAYVVGTARDQAAQVAGPMVARGVATSTDVSRRGAASVQQRQRRLGTT